MPANNPSPYKFLFQLLAELLTGLVKLNNYDPALQPIISKINQILGSKHITSAKDVLQLITHAQDIVKGYDIDPSEIPSDDPVANLPGIFYNLNIELENLITKDKLVNKSSITYRINQLNTKLATFYWMLKK